MFKKFLITLISFLIVFSVLVYAQIRQDHLLDRIDHCDEDWNVFEEGVNERNQNGYYACLGDTRNLTPAAWEVE